MLKTTTKKVFSLLLMCSLLMALVSVGASAASPVYNFIEDFSGYTTTYNSKDNCLLSVSGTPQTLLSGDKFNWVLSGRRIGTIAVGGTVNPGAWLENGGLVIRDRWTYGTAVNLVPSEDIAVSNIKSLYAEVYRNGGCDRTAATRMAVDVSEKTYLLFDTYKNNDKVDNNLISTYETKRKGEPYMAIVKDGKTIAYSDSVTHAAEFGKEWNKYKEPFVWTVDVEGNTVNWHVSQLSDDGTTTTEWSGTITDSAVGGIIAGAEYPVAAVPRADGYERYDNIKLEMDINEYNYGENFDSYTTTYNTKENRLLSVSGEPQTFISGKNYSWVTSGTQIGLITNDPTINPGVFLDNGRIAVYGRYTNATAVNLAPAEKIDVNDINALGFKVYRSGGCDVTGGMRFAINEAENTYINCDTYWSYDQIDGVPVKTHPTKRNGEPYLSIVKDGTTIAISDSVVHAVDAGTEWNESQYPFIWDITVNGNTINWAVTQNKSTGTDYVTKTWYGSVTNDAVSGIIKDTKYPVAAIVRGDRQSWIDDIKLDMDTTTYDFTENFDSYTTTYNSRENRLFSVKNEPKTMLSATDYSWELSGVHLGETHLSKPEINADEDPGAWLENGRISIYDRFNRGTTLNLKLGGNTVVNDISKVCFDSYRPGPCSITAGAFVALNAAENTYIKLDTYRYSDSYDGQNVSTYDTKRKGEPYVAIIKDGNELAVSDSITHAVAVGEEYNEKTYPFKWNVTIDGNKVIWNVTQLATDNVTTNTWSGTLTNEEIPNIIANAVYPIAALSRGDSVCGIDNIKIAMDCAKIYTVDNQGNATINIAPAHYAPKKSKITAVVAYYSSTGTLLSTQIESVENLSEIYNFTADAPSTVGGTFKLFVWDGEITKMSPLAETLPLN